MASYYCLKYSVRNTQPVNWTNGIVRKVNEIKLKHTQFENYNELEDDFMRIASEDIALLKVRLHIYRVDFKN